MTEWYTNGRNKTLNGDYAEYVISRAYDEEDTREKVYEGYHRMSAREIWDYANSARAWFVEDSMIEQMCSELGLDYKAYDNTDSLMQDAIIALRSYRSDERKEQQI